MIIWKNSAFNPDPIVYKALKQDPTPTDSLKSNHDPKFFSTVD